MTSIFIVEDELPLQKLYEYVLTMAGYEICGRAKNGEEAVQMYKSFEKKPDLIIMDNLMPIKNGIEATKEILQINKNQKVIFASADNTVKKYALSIGALCFKVKLFDNQRLINNIEKALKQTK